MKRTKKNPIVGDMRKAALGKEFPTLQSARVFHEILPEVLERFLEKNRDYGEAAVHLGSKGQFADMNRKYWKMKAELWDGKKLESEPIEEVLEDMIGHCLLTLLFLRGEDKTSKNSINSFRDAVIVNEVRPKLISDLRNIEDFDEEEAP